MGNHSLRGRHFNDEEPVKSQTVYIKLKQLNLSQWLEHDSTGGVEPFLYISTGFGNKYSELG